MKRIVMLLTVVALIMVMLAMAVGSAFATQPVVGSPQGGGSSRSSNNCAAYNSAQVIHNGSAVRNQDRQTEVKGMQASCNNANQK